MTAEDLAHPPLINNHDQLDRLVDHLSKQTIVAVDTESNSLFAYHERVCLIQFSTLEGDYLVDPLALDDLSPLAPIFKDATIEKVFHAAEYDVLCLRRDFGFQFTNLFDTMIAARILGYKKFGLGSLLESEFGVNQDKRYQRADWGKRPIEPHMLDYARQDTRYLIQLRNRLLFQLEKKDLLELAREDFDRVSNVDGYMSAASKRLNHFVNPWRIRGAYDLAPDQAAVLFQLCRYRDQIASRLDRPLFKVFNDQTLLEIAHSLPQSSRDLYNIRGLGSRSIKRHGRKILKAVQRGLHSEPLYPPMHPKPDERYVRRVDRLREWRKMTAQHMGVNSDVVLPRELLYRLAAKNPTTNSELELEMKEVPWRFRQFGGQILAVLKEE